MLIFVDICRRNGYLCIMGYLISWGQGNYGLIYRWKRTAQLQKRECIDGLQTIRRKRGEEKERCLHTIQMKFKYPSRI